MFQIKNTIRFAAGVIFAITLLLFYFGSAKASSPFELVVEGGGVTDGYVNSSNTSFSVNNIDISSLQIGQIANLSIKSASASILLQSYTEPAIESYTMPSGKLPRDYFASGANIVKLEISDLTGIISEIELPPVIADFDMPNAAISSDIVSGVLKIGDSVTFTIMPDEKLEKVNAAYNNKAISWTENPDLSWTGIYPVKSGDTDQLKPLALSGVKITDLAGNSAVLADQPTNFTIDANAPKTTIQSPENSKIYNMRDIPLQYSVNDPKATVTVLLNGKPIDPKANLNLSDGSYKLSIRAIDEAGNVTIVYSNFSVDTTAPDFSAPINPDGGRVEKGWTVVFDGTTEPGAKVKVEIFSDPLSQEVTADADGRYRIEFYAGDLETGSHEAYITVTDQAGNSRRIKISSFEVYSIASEQEPTKIALAASSIASDVKPAINKSKPAKEEPIDIAKSGQLGSATDSTRAGAINWSAWIILLGLVVFASALATAGYYGYEWLAVSSEARRMPTYKKDAHEKTIGQEEQADISQTISEIAQNLEKSEKKIEHQQEGDETPKTRW